MLIHIHKHCEKHMQHGILYFHAAKKAQIMNRRRTGHSIILFAIFLQVALILGGMCCDKRAGRLRAARSSPPLQNMCSAVAFTIFSLPLSLSELSFLNLTSETPGHCLLVWAHMRRDMDALA